MVVESVQDESTVKFTALKDTANRLFVSRDFSAARRLYDDALNINGVTDKQLRAAVLHNRGRCRGQMGDWRGAAADALLAIAQVPLYNNAVKLLSSAVSQLGDEEKAAEESDQSCFRIVPIEGKGLGVVATRPIGVGECVLRESALFTVRHQPVRSGGEEAARRSQWREMEEQIPEQLSKLSQEQRDTFFSLANSHPEMKNPSLGIFVTNTHAIATADDTGLAGLFPIFSRINHSCYANCFWGDYGVEKRLYAGRPIAEGEEIHYRYYPYQDVLCDPEGRFRRGECGAHWGFLCACERCLPVEQETLDKRRKSAAIFTHLQRLSPVFTDLKSTRSSSTVHFYRDNWGQDAGANLRACEELLELSFEEGLYTEPELLRDVASTAVSIYDYWEKFQPHLHCPLDYPKSKVDTWRTLSSSLTRLCHNLPTLSRDPECL